MRRFTFLAIAALGCIAAEPTWARTWTSRDGLHTTEADLVAVEKGDATLKKADGAEVIVPLTKLSESDRRFALAWKKDQGKSTPGGSNVASSKGDVALYPIPSFGSYGFIDSKGKMVIPPSFQGAVDFSEGLGYVNQGGKWGFINGKGKIVIPPQFEFYEEPQLSGFHDGLARVKLNGKYGFVNKTGKPVVPCKFVAARDFSEGLAYVVEKDLGGYIDTAGKMVIEPIHNNAVGGGDFHEGLVCITDTKQRHFLVDKTGKTVLDNIDDYVGSFADGMATKRGVVKKTGFGAMGYIGKDGKWVIEPSAEWNAPGPFHDGGARVQLAKSTTGPVSFIDKTGKVFAPGFDDGQDFSEGLAAVRSGKSWQFIDTTGKMVAGGDDWQMVRPFTNGLAFVHTLKGKNMYIDKTGKVVYESQ